MQERERKRESDRVVAASAQPRGRFSITVKDCDGFFFIAVEQPQWTHSVYVRPAKAKALLPVHPDLLYEANTFAIINSKP